MHSLPDLPTELLMEIIKYYPELYLDIDAAIRGVSSEQFDGNDVLRALSQTSHVLRGIFLPLLWARVHACFTARNRPKRKIRTRAKMLERRMIGIRKTPYVVPHIRYARSALVFLSQQILISVQLLVCHAVGMQHGQLAADGRIYPGSRPATELAGSYYRSPIVRNDPCA
jgi:hypothetical protein